MSSIPSFSWVDSHKIRPSRWNAEFYKKEFTHLDNSIESSGISSKRLKSLSKLFTGPFGSKLPASLYNTEGGIPLLRVQNIGELFLNDHDMAFIPKEVHLDIIRSMLIPGDIALAKAGRLGALSRIPHNIKECNITQHIVGIRVNKNKVNSEYLTAFLMSKYGEYQLRRQAVGTIIKYLGIEETRDATVILPDDCIQGFIGKHIALAERCKYEADILEEKAQMLLELELGQSFSEILSDINLQGVFEHGGFSVIVEPNSLRNRLDPIGYHPELLGIQKNFHAKNPKYQKLRKLVKLTASNRVRVNANCAYFISVLHVDNKGYLDKFAASGYHPESPGREAKDDDILVSCINPAANRTAVCDDMEGTIACSPEFAILESKELPPHYLAYILRSELVLRQMIHLGKGTSSSRRRIDEDELLDLEVPVISRANEIASLIKKRQKLISRAFQLTADAKSDVESLVEGKLDTDAILTGKLKAPTWEDIEKELEVI